MYTDDTLLTFGKYKFVRLSRVPPEYLLKMYENKGYVNPELKEYIESNVEKIIARRDGIIPTPNIERVCEKLTFASEKIAKANLRDIATVKQEHKKPVRVYECEKCGGWHLTSLSYEVWEKRNEDKPKGNAGDSDNK